jgi:hypothetical protein
LIRKGLLIFGRAFEQKFIRVKDAIFSEMAGDNRLRLITQQVRFGTLINNCQARPRRVCDCFVQNIGESALGFDGCIVAGDLGDLEGKIQRLRVY